MTDIYQYLATELVDVHGMRTDLEQPVAHVAEVWLQSGIHPAAIEIATEFLARWAAELGEHLVTADIVESSLRWLDLPGPVLELIRRALQDHHSATHLAALAVHLLDIAERLALDIYVTELGPMATRSDRSADAARRVGSARHLKG